MITLAAIHTSTPYNLFSGTTSNSMVGTDYSNNASGIHTQSSGHTTNTTLIFIKQWTHNKHNTDIHSHMVCSAVETKEGDKQHRYNISM